MEQPRRDDRPLRGARPFRRVAWLALFCCLLRSELCTASEVEGAAAAFGLSSTPGTGPVSSLAVVYAGAHPRVNLWDLLGPLSQRVEICGDILDL